FDNARQVISGEAGAGLSGQEVDAGRLGAQLDALAVRQKPRDGNLVDDRPDLAEAPTQRPARVVRYVPEHVTQLFTTVPASRQRQIGEQRSRLSGGRSGRRYTVPDHFETAEDPDLQHRELLC